MTSSLDMKVHNCIFVISLACFSFKTENASVSFFSCVCTKGESWSHIYLAETVETRV